MQDELNETTGDHEASTFSSLKTWLTGYRNYVSELVSLVFAECRLAAASFVQLMFLAVLAAIIVACSWLVMCAIIGTYLVGQGVSVIMVLVLILVLHLCLLGGIGWGIYSSLSGLQFRYTRDHLTGEESFDS